MQQEVHDEQRSTRAMTRGKPMEIGNSNLTSKSCVSDAIRLWNAAPDELQNSASLHEIKKSAKNFVVTLPVLTL